MWFLLSIFSALIYSLRGILEKKTIKNVNKYILGYAVRLFALPFLLIPLFFKPQIIEPITHPNPHFWIAVIFLAIVCTPIETYFYYSALKDQELTTALPILSLGPILILLIGSFLLKEVPNLFGLFGVVLITIGIYSLKIHHAREGFFEPLKHLGRNKAIQFMFIVMISQSAGGIIDKIGVSSSNAYIFAIMNYLFVCISLTLIVLLKAKAHIKQLITYFKSFLLIGAVVSSYTLLYLLALETGFAAYVSAIKNSYILFSIILGIIFLKEKEGKQKIFAGIIIVAGLAFIKIFS